MLEELFSRFTGSQCALLGSGQELVFNGCLTALARDENYSKLQTERAADEFWYSPDDWRAYYRPYVVRDGILYIPVKGVLLHDFPFSYGSWATGYAYIWKAYERGMADPEVRGIALMIHSPGGEVAGCFDLVDKMVVNRKKPVRAFAHEAAYSAAYAVATAADHIVMSRTGGVGSIGVITMHVDISKMLDAQGYKVTFIYAGQHKKDGNSFEPLPESVKERIQKRIDGLYSVFTSTVARNRNLDEQSVRATEALTYSDPEAISVGLADSVGSLDDAVAAFAADLSANEGDEQMSDNKDQAAANQAAIDAARAEGKTQGVAEGKKDGATAERTRIKSILASDTAKARPKAAMQVALSTDMSAEAAEDFLKGLDEEKPQASGQQPTGFENAMDNAPHPELGAGQDGGDQIKGADAIFASAGIPPRK